MRETERERERERERESERMCETDHMDPILTLQLQPPLGCALSISQ
jgi:hypothetical protein